MAESQKKIIWDRLARLRLPAQAGFLGGIVVVVAMPLAAAAYAISGFPGVYATLAAGCVCLLGGEVALGLSGLLDQRLGVLQAVLIGMLARMAFPLLLGIVVHLLAPSLTKAGLFFYFLVFYLVILAVETILAMAHLSRESTSNKAL
jgi:hypothetical protein